MIDNSENIIIKLDSCFTINALEKKEYVSRKKFRRITKYLSGHLPGYFMADVIRKNGLLQELIDNSDNPFNFFYVYNKAAKMDKENPIMFSDVTINYLKSLELKAYK